MGILPSGIKNNANEIQKVKDMKRELVNIGLITPCERNKRLFTVDDKLKDSIDSRGLLVQLVVNKRDDGKYIILSGERRYTALKSLLKDDKDFKYKFKNLMYSPTADGVVCDVDYNKYTDEELDALIISYNNNRNIENSDKLEIYERVIAMDEEWKAKREAKELKWGIGREVEVIGKELHLDPKTVQTIKDGNWAYVNPSNYEAVKEAGSYLAYEEQLANTSVSVAEPAYQKVANTYSDLPTSKLYEKEIKAFEKLKERYEKLNLDELAEWQRDDIANYAVDAILSVMSNLGLEKKDLYMDKTDSKGGMGY